MTWIIVRSRGHSTCDPVVDDASYVRWYDSGPFDIGLSTECGLKGEPMLDSQGNGALMRISPLGIFGWNMEAEALAKAAAKDAALTHPHRNCQQVNGLYAAAIAEATREGYPARDVYDRMAAWATQWNVDDTIRDRLEQALTHRPPEYSRQMGWVLIAFQNALYELLLMATQKRRKVANTSRADFCSD